MSCSTCPRSPYNVGSSTSTSPRWNQYDHDTRIAAQRVTLQLTSAACHLLDMTLKTSSKPAPRTLTILADGAEDATARDLRRRPPLVDSLLDRRLQRDGAYLLELADQVDQAQPSFSCRLSLPRGCGARPGAAHKQTNLPSEHNRVCRRGSSGRKSQTAPHVGQPYALPLAAAGDRSGHNSGHSLL